MDTHAHDDHHEDHHGGLAKYGIIFVCLSALTACSFMTTQEWWPFEKAPTWIFMMGVSCVKAMLVILFFMHLLWEANWKYVLTIPCAMMSVFLVMMLIPDVGNRGQSEHRRSTLQMTRVPSRPGEFHPESLTDPDVILSHHPAHAIA